MAIKAHTFLLKKKYSNNPELINHLEEIDLAVNQSEKIFEFSRLYEKIGSEQQSNVNVGDSFDQAVKLLLHETGKIKVTNECQSLTVLADSMLRELLYNLIDNSIKHGEKTTEVKLSYLKESNDTILVYEDNGVGVPEDKKDRIFEGYTTGGSGLGLKLVKRMIEAYGWSIKESGTPQGARFEITIPN